ncbi:MAG TPA: ATP-binding protein [Chitinophaga sp.]|uniref:sensor histidine kinase n=1 Tax=Chitinophaga sp. TaxID=1869181 RepID=UPI002CF72089|nr:ATP-binding protein [Chitinophaga sp.]HVI44077.1 ATP-binding protein [Chitinophaga sp.]
MITEDTNNHTNLIFNHANIGMLLADGGNNVLLANPFLLNLLGYTGEELQGRRATQLIPALFSDTPPGTARELVAIRKNGTTIPVEVVVSQEDEDHKIVCITEKPIRNLSAGEEDALLITGLRDQIVAQEQIIRELEYELQIAGDKDRSTKGINNFLRSIWLNVDAIMMVTNREGFIRWFNPVAEKALGYKQAEVIDLYDLTRFLDKEQLAERATAFSEELAQHIHPDMETLTIKARLHMPNEYEWDYIRKDGSRFPVSLNISAIQDGHLTTGYIAIALDITERKQSELELRNALGRERELNSLKSRFVSLASHEFRTPLSTIKSSTYLISKYETAADQVKRQKHIQRIISSVNMLTDILNDFLSVGIIEEGKIQVRNSFVSTGKYVGNIISELDGLKRESQHIYYAHHGLQEVYLDPTLLKHIVMNLVSNAIKFSPDEAVISVRTQCTEEKFVLSVKDKGIGIPPEDMQHLYDRFFRGSNVANIQGTGLGLHIVARYAELMKGNVTCKSEPGHGTEFTVTIPSIPPPQN